MTVCELCLFNVIQPDSTCYSRMVMHRQMKCSAIVDSMIKSRQMNPNTMKNKSVCTDILVCIYWSIIV